MNLMLTLKEKLERAVRILPEDCAALIREAARTERSEQGRKVLERIQENMELAEKGTVPLCQDCGMFHILVSVGRDAHVDIGKLENQISLACLEAARDANYRKSVVAEPVYERPNTRDNLPAVFNWEVVDGDSVSVDILLKGFGSENCSSVRMIRPTDGEDGVLAAVLDMVKSAGGKPCPPMFLGVGIGGTMDKAAMLSKKALARDTALHHPDPRYAALEERILREVNSLGIGPGGLGGDHSCLSVAIESYPTHIAGLPVALSVNCWADRKVHISFKGAELEEN